MHNIHCECLCDMWAFFRCHSLSNFNFCNFSQNKSNRGPSAQLEFSFVSLNCHQKKREKSSCAFTLTAGLFCWNLPRSFQQSSKKKRKHPSVNTHCVTYCGVRVRWQRGLLMNCPAAVTHPPASSRPYLEKPAQAKKIERRLSSSLDFYYPWRRNHSRWSSLVRLIHIHRSYIMKHTHTHTLEAV